MRAPDTRYKIERTGLSVHVTTSRIINFILFLGHPALGAFTALVGIFVSPVFAVMIFAGFIIYELSEDWRITDFAYYDIRDYLWGFCTTIGTDLSVVLIKLI